MDNFSDEDLTNARMNRELKRNPPQSDPGMDDDWESSFSDSSFGGNGGFGASGGGFGGDTGFGGGNLGTSGGGWGSQFNTGMQSAWGAPMGQQEQNSQQKSDEDKFWDAVSKVAKPVGGMLKEFGGSFSQFDVVCRAKFGKYSMYMGVGAIVLAIILKVVLNYSSWLHMIGGSGLAIATGGFFFLFNFADLKENGYSEAEQSIENTGMQETSFDSGFEDNSGSFEDDDFGFDEDDDFPDDDFSDDDFPDDPYDDESDDPFVDLVPDNTDLGANMDKALSDVDAYIDKGMITRQFLYENIVPCIKTLNSNFDTVHEIDEDTEAFDEWDARVQKAAQVIAPSNIDDYPVLLRAREKLFYVQLEVERVKWIKNVQQFADEIVSAYAFDPDTHQIKEGVYGLATAAGDTIYIKIMKGAKAFVSVKDTYERVKGDILDSKNYLPIVLGIGSDGQVVWRDFKKMYSLLVTGKPRTGKSWFVKSVLAQMMFWLKPSELQFVLLDPKGDTSDFIDIRTPHVRKFVSTDKGIVDELRYIVNVEAPRRKALMKQMGGYIDFLDLKRDHPEIDFPMLYVVIDEVVTLSERMDKDVKSEFQALLAQFVSQLPALGLRIFMVPHVIKNDIIKKTTSDLIACRISVMGDPDHIESSTGTKPKDFPQRLTTMGDMAVKLDNDPTVFVHGAVLSDTNEGVKEMFAFLARFWSKIEPESIKGSVLDVTDTEKSDGVVKEPKVKVQDVHKLSDAEYSDLIEGVNNDADLDEDTIDLTSLFD